MHHYDIYRDQLSITHPSFGLALWDPAPESVYGPVKIGDVGYVREGRFFRLFNALLPADDPSHNKMPLPEHHEPLIPNFRNHLYRETWVSGPLLRMACPSSHSSVKSCRMIRLPRNRVTNMLRLQVALRCDLHGWY